MPKKDCVEHFDKGASAWGKGFGWFIRQRGIIASSSAIFAIIVAVLTATGAPWWAGVFLPFLHAQITAGVVIALLVAALGVFAVLGLIYLRRRTLRSLYIKELLHDVAHYLREFQTALLKSTAADHDHERLREYATKVCDFAREYFSLLTQDSTVSAAFRIAIEPSDPRVQHRCVYRTIGRARGLNPQRAKTSEDIPSNQGIPRYFSDRLCKGVLLYNDLQQAIRFGALKETHNERLYPDEIDTMFVAPVNGWDEDDQMMLGILYITSRNCNTFHRKHVDCLKFFADMIAPSLVLAVWRLVRHRTLAVSGGTQA